MHDSELADPYMTPRTLPARRPYKYLAYGIILVVVLLALAAGSLMVLWAMAPSRLILDRGPAVDRRGQLIEQRRGPSVLPSTEQPANAQKAVAP